MLLLLISSLAIELERHLIRNQIDRLLILPDRFYHFDVHRRKQTDRDLFTFRTAHNVCHTYVYISSKYANSFLHECRIGGLNKRRLDEPLLTK